MVKNRIVYFTSGVEIDPEVRQLFEKRSDLLVCHSLHEVKAEAESSKEAIELLAVDLRHELWRTDYCIKGR